MRRSSLGPIGAGASPRTSPSAPEHAPASDARLTEAVAALHQVTPQGSGVRIDAIDDYLKLICGFEHDASHVLPAFRTQTLALLDERGMRHRTAEASGPLTSLQCHLLALLYFSLCRNATFLRDGAFDVDGLQTFLSQRLALSPSTIASMLSLTLDATPSPFASLHQVADGLGDRLQVGDTTDLAFHAPPITLADMPTDALRNAYLRRLQLRHTHLRSLDLTGADLRDVTFAHCRFTEVHFRHMSMRKGRFEHCEFDHCVFEAVDLERLTMSGCRVVGSRWSQCNMQHAQWRGIELWDSMMQDCCLAGTRLLPATDRTIGSEAFDVSEIGDCHFERCVWDDAVLLRVNLQRSTWHDSVFRRGRIIHTLWQDCALSTSPLTDTVIQQSRLFDCMLDGLDARRTVWHTVSLCQTSVADIDLSLSTITALNCTGPCNFTRAQFDHARLDKMTVSGPISFSHASFRGARLSHLLFLGHRTHRSIDLSFAQFTDSYVHMATFQRCLMRDAGFASARLGNTVFRGCDLTRANFTRCGCPDLVCVGLVNLFTDARFGGMIPCLNAAILQQLRDHTQRSQLLDPDLSDDQNTCLTTQIQRFPDFAVRVQLWEILTEQLMLMSDDALEDVDTPVLSVLLGREYANQRALHVYIDSRLHDHLQILSDHGLPLGQASAQDWRRRAVPHLCRLLGTMTDADRLSASSPLIAFLFTADECAALTLSHADRTYLRRAQSLCLPASLAEAFYDIMNHAPFELPAYRFFISPNVDHAVFVTPDAAPGLLGIVARPVIPEHSYLYFKRTLDSDVRPWKNEGNQRPDIAFAPFPRLGVSLRDRYDRLHGLIATYALPDSIRARVLDGFVHRIPFALVDPDAQRTLSDIFDPLCTPIPPYANDRGVTEAVHIISHLRPTSDHRRDVLAALAPWCPDGDDEALGLCCIAYASLIFDAASAAIFGTEYQSPMALRRYGMAWANLGFATLPTLSDAMPRWSRHDAQDPVVVTQPELVARCFGLNDRVSHCAALIARDLAAPLQSPRFQTCPCVPSLRALLG